MAWAGAAPLRAQSDHREFDATLISPTMPPPARKARRVFATMDKHAQIMLTANDHLMGERFSNRGPLTLAVRHAGAPGRTVAELTIIEGVPGRNGTVSEPARTADIVITPAAGPHFSRQADPGRRQVAVVGACVDKPTARVAIVRTPTLIFVNLFRSGNPRGGRCFADSFSTPHFA